MKKLVLTLIIFVVAFSQVKSQETTASITVIKFNSGVIYGNNSSVSFQIKPDGIFQFTDFSVLGNSLIDSANV